MADRNENLVAERVNRTAMTWLHQYDETFEPPQQNVLGVRVVGAELHLVISSERSNHDTTTYRTEADVCVDLVTFLKALACTTEGAMFVQFVQLIDLARVAATSTPQEADRG